MNSYDDSRPFDCSRTTADERYVRAADALEAELDGGGRSSTIRRQTLSLLINITRLHQFPSHNYISVGKAEGYFREQEQNHAKISYKLIDVLNKARDKGLIEEIIGFNDPTGGSRLTRIKPTQRIIDDYILKFDLEKAKTERNISPVILRGKNKKKTKFKPNKITREYERVTNTYNQFLKTQTVSLSADKKQESTKIDFSDCELYRVFNRGSFKKGGRFYGSWWMNLPKILRGFIEINGQETIELDFQAQHVFLIYGREGIPYIKQNKDPYKVDGYHRETVKKAIVTAINCKNRQQAWRGCLNALQQEHPSSKILDYETIVGPVDTKKGYNTLLEKILEVHPPLDKYLCSDKGVDLMFLDSEICRHILNEMTQKKCPVLPVHDSFIVASTQKKELLKAAANAYGLVCPAGIAPMHSENEKINLGKYAEYDL